MALNKIQINLIENSDNQELMKKAVNEGKFYVVATPCIVGYAIGCFDDSVPALNATKEEAMAENEEMIDLYNDQIKRKERDNGDNWQGEVLEVHWDCVSDDIELFSEGDFIHRESWKSLAGI